MLHFTSHSVHGRYLFHDWEEARRLWDLLLAAMPVHALVLMPDHVHLLVRTFDAHRWQHAASAYARWLNHRRGETGSLFRPSRPEPVPDRLHLERLHRYILLNPCRGALVQDPLAWPFSTHRDRVGLALPPALASEPDAHGFHRHVSADRTVHREGTHLPVGPGGVEAPTVSQVVGAVSSLTRTPASLLLRKGPARRLLVRALRALTACNTRQIARRLGLHHGTVARIPATGSPETRLVERVLEDARFRLLAAGDLTGTEGWRSYAAVRRSKRLPSPR